jgi:glycine cleavage system H protein
MNIPADLKFTKSDEWVRVEGGAATVGLSDYAQNQLSDIVYVELPPVGDAFEAGQQFGSVESVKAAAEINLPIGGTVTAVNDALSGTPELINKDPYGEGWLVKISVKNAAELGALMDAAAYQKYCEEREH